MKIEFENGNKITTINDTEEAARSKIKYYQKHPDEYIEEILNIKLLPYQKVLLKSIAENKQIIMGRWNSKDYLSDLYLEYLKAMYLNFTAYTKNGIEKYENGKLIETIKI